MAGCAGGSTQQPRWGILAVGHISSDFCAALVTNGSTISAVGARDEKRAQEFAAKVGAKRAYGSYQGVVDDASVDVVYVGSIHTMHKEHVKMALNAGKHVLCEKPMALNEADMKEMVELAKEKQLFLMEAIWTRLFPAIEKARAVLASGELGAPRGVQVNFGFVPPADDSHRMWDPNQAGGAMLDIGIYMVQLAVMVFGQAKPDQIACTGRLTALGVDKEGTLAVTWKDQGSASMYMSLETCPPEVATIMCEKGNLTIHDHHCPTKITVSKRVDRGKFQHEDFVFELPKFPEDRPVNFPNSEGMLYEVRGVERALRQGSLECPECTLGESAAIVRIMDEYRKQVGVVYPFER